MYLAEQEGDEYMSEGEDGRLCIKWRRKLSRKPTGEEREIVEKTKETEIEVEEKMETENS